MTMKSKREEWKLTQDEMAKLLEIPVRSYQLIEQKNSCSLRRAYSISQVLGCTIEEIFFNNKKEDS